METAKGGILNEEMRRNAQGSSSQSEVLVTENRERIHKKEPKGGRENSIRNSKLQYKNMECHYYHKTGHVHKCFYHDDYRVTTDTSDDLVILRDHDSVNLVSY